MKKIVTIIIVLLLTGCYNYKELNKLSIVSSISIDKKDNEFLVGAQVLNIKTKDETNSSKILVFEEKGKSIEEALRKMTTKSNKTLYGGHLSKIVISEEVAKEGIINIIDLFQRLPEIKDEFNITISRGIEANKVIKIITSQESIPADYVKNTISSADIESALTYSSKLDEFSSYYLKKYIDPVISVIEVKNYSKDSEKIENNESSYPTTTIILDNIATTHNGKLEKFLNKNETIGYNFIRDSIKQMVIPIKCDKKNYSSISIIKSKTKYKVKKENKRYIINLTITSNGMINEYNCNNKINENEIKKLQKKSEKKIKEYINDTLSVQKKVNSEFLGLKRMIYLNYPKYDNEKYEVNINVNVNISRKGEINNSSKGEKNEY